MDNQHKLVKGYCDLSQSEIDAINSIKLAEQDIGQLFQQVRKVEGVDQRCLAVAKTQLQQAFSWFVRAVAQPLDVYELELSVPEDNFITRLKTERDELVERLDKLGKFLASPQSDNVPAEALDDLKLQHKIMTELGFILSKRYDEVSA